MKVDFNRLDRAFNPQCVAVIGDSGDLRWVRGQLTFKGKLYSVQINPKTVETIEALGVKNYASLLDIPEPVDLAIVSVPRGVAPRILEDCLRKEVAAAHFFTAGFAETVTEEGRRLENQLAERAKQENFYLIGPNCVGIFNPRVGIRQYPTQYTDSFGAIGFISQSGNHAVDFAFESHLQGTDINKSVSIGNGSVLDSPDFLEYFSQDSGIKIIGMYLEGIKDGRRFLSVLKRVSAKKPVVIWKGGRTGEGGRAIASHTGSLAVPHAIWRAAVRQCGAIDVTNLEELVDTIKALLYLSPVHGNRVGIAGGSGGQSVAIADAFAEAGLVVPLLTQESYDNLATFFTLIGGSCINPIDTGNANRSEIKRIVEILERDPNIDNLVLLVRVREGVLDSRTLEGLIRTVVDIKKATLKPLMAVIPYSHPREMEIAQNITKRLGDAAVPAFATFERAARAMKNTLDYYKLTTS